MPAHYKKETALLTPKEIIAMFEEYFSEHFAHQSELFDAQRAAATNLIIGLEQVPSEEKLAPINRFLAWNNFPSAAADGVRWPVDFFAAQTRLVQLYLDWFNQSQRAFSAFWTHRD
jgi:hypothetical protein